MTYHLTWQNRMSGTDLTKSLYMLTACLLGPCSICTSQTQVPEQLLQFIQRLGVHTLLLQAFETLLQDV